MRKTYFIPMDIKQTIKERFSQQCLNTIAKLPKFQGGWIAHLQDLRKRQIEQAVKYVAKSKRPADNDITLNNLYVYELFFLEDFPKLEKNLFNIYSKQKRKSFDITRTINHYKEFINRASGYFSYGSWQNLGWISSEDKKDKYLPSFVKAYFKDFPKEFKHIKLELYHILPSVIVVSFNITFEKEVAEQIESLINRSWQSKITFSSMPWKFGFSQTSPDQEKELAVFNYFQELRKKAECFIGKYFSGYFLSNIKDTKTPKCPSVEVFNMSELPQGEDLADVTKDNRDFWESLGFKWWRDFNIFKNKNLAFISATYDSHSLKYPHRLIIQKNTLNAEVYGSIESAINNEAFYFLQGYTNSIVLFELCNKMMDYVGQLRFTTGKNIFSKQIFPGRFSKLLRFNERVDREIFIMDRLVSEYEHIRKKRSLIWKEDQCNTVLQLKSHKKLSDCFLDAIDEHVSLIKTQYLITKNSFENYLNGMNLKTSYALQRKVLWLTIFLVIGLLIQILLASISEQSKLKTWSEFQNWKNQFIKSKNITAIDSKKNMQ